MVLLDRLFADIELGRSHGAYPQRPGGRSTRQLRAVLSGMLGLAIRPIDLLDFDTDTTKLHVRGTLIEPRTGFVDRLHRQDTTNNHEDRILLLPDTVATMLKSRIDRIPPGPQSATSTTTESDPSPRRAINTRPIA